MDLWNKSLENKFFTNSLNLTTREKLFYLTNDNRYVAYWPKIYRDKKDTLQSRNSFIGEFTEKWSAELFNDIAASAGGYAVQKVVCEELALSKKSPADIAICTTKDKFQKPKNIIMIIEVKMSIVWNWEYIQQKESGFDLISIGDYRTHSGNPGLLRSDTMLKAIGKSLNIRISNYCAASIPIIIIGNTPIQESYYEKVDNLKMQGIIQGFWSINPSPLDNNTTIKNTDKSGFLKFDTYEELKNQTTKLLNEDHQFFSSMQTKKKLGEIIEIANREVTYEAKAIKFLELLRKSE